jgi:hypothetical protein
VDDIGLNVTRHRLMLPDPYQLTVEVHLAVPSFLLEIVCSIESDGVFRWDLGYKLLHSDTAVLPPCASNSITSRTASSVNTNRLHYTLKYNVTNIVNHVTLLTLQYFTSL